MNQKLRDARKALKLKQTEVAFEAGISYRQYQKIEAGGSSPSVDKAIKIASILKVSVEEIFGDSEHENYNISTPKENICNHEDYMNEGVRVVNIIQRAAQILNCSNRVARLMTDIGKNGQVNSEEFRPIFEELREVVSGAFV